MKWLLTLEHVFKQRGTFQLGPIDLNIPQGYVTGIIGPNGAGKTTLLELCAGLIYSQAGRIILQDKEIQANRLEWRREIGYVGDTVDIHGEFRVGEAVEWVLKFYERYDRDYVYSLVERLQLDTKKKVKHLSKGMRVKLSLILALVHRPSLLLLDEPTAGLDPLIRGELLDILREVMLDEERSVVLSSHITSDLEEIADYIIYLIDGKVAVQGEKEQLREDWLLVAGEEMHVGDSLKSTLVGYNKQGKIIRGLLHRSKRSLLSSQLQITKPTLDELLRHFTKELAEHDQIPFA